MAVTKILARKGPPADGIGYILNREHIHAHTIFNSVNADTGRKYHSNAKSYYGQVRAISDRLCREHGRAYYIKEDLRAEIERRA